MNPPINISQNQLQKKFKHAVDFGIMGNYNQLNSIQFKQAILFHLDHNQTNAIKGTYRGQNVTHFYNPVSDLNVIVTIAGNFITGWRLTQKQAEYLTTTGNLGGSEWTIIILRSISTYSLYL